MSETTNALDGSINHENQFDQCLEFIGNLRIEDTPRSPCRLPQLNRRIHREVEGLPDDFSFQMGDVEFRAVGRMMEVRRSEVCYVPVYYTDIPDEEDDWEDLYDFAYENAGMDQDWYASDWDCEQEGFISAVEITPSGLSRLRDAIAASLTAEVA